MSTIACAVPASEQVRLPYSPRPLTLPERRRLDLYLYMSPKAGRQVDLIGCLRMAFAMGLEFNPDVLAYVERPRTLAVGDQRTEFDFWTSEAHGRERFWLLVTADETVHPNSPRHEHRRAQALVEAAQAAQISVEFVFEEDLLRRADELYTWYRLLPYVQTALHLPSRMVLREQVLAVLKNVPRATLDQVEAELHRFNRADVRAAIAHLIHAGQVKLDKTANLSRFSVLHWRGAHGQV
jgi:hypothetical protein